MIHKTIIYSIWIVCLIIISPCFGNDSKVQLSSEEKTWLNQDHTVRVRIGSAPPFMLTDDKIRGMAIDYLTYIFNQHGIKIQYIQESEVTWPQALKYIEAHEVVDMVPTAKITDERKNRMLFTDEYLFAPWVIFTRSKADFIGSIEDLKGKTMSVEEGFVIHKKLKRDYPEIKLKVVSAKLQNYAEIPIRDLSTGLVDAYIGNLIMTTYMIQSKGYTNIKVAAPTPFDNHNQAMAMRNDWPELASIINKTLAGMTPDEHATILNRWLSIRYEYGINKTDILKWILGIIGIFAIIFSVIIIWNRKLQKSEKKYKDLFESMTQGVFYQNVDGSLLDINNAALKMFGITSDQFYGTNPYDPRWKIIKTDNTLIPPEEYPSLVVLNTGKAIKNYEMGIFNPEKDHYTWLSVSAVPRFREDEKKPFQVFVTLHDITDRIKAEEALRKNEERFRGIIESMADWIWEVHTQGRYTYCSKKVESVLGYTAEEMIGKTPFDFMTPNEAEKIGEIFGKIITEKGSIKNLENWNLSKDGRDVCLITNGVPILDNSGTLFGYRGVDSDITDSKKAEIEQKRLEATLQQALKMESIGQLAGGIAHDFNNILYPIIGFTELSIQELPRTHKIQENLQDILVGAKRARDLVKQILQFSRQEKQILQPTILQPVIEEVMRLLKTTIPANIDIQCHLYNGEDDVLCDSTEIHEIVMNLCTNAYHSVEENGGTIIVRLNKQNPSPDLNLPSGEYICLSVIDNGVGIPEEIIDKIFEPYLTTKEIGKGSGLGLSVVHGIVNNYKGNISVKSSPGKGSAFNVFLPITTQSRTVKQELIKDKSLGGAENILFVDDEASIIKLATRILERMGYKITGKTSCIEALELFTEKPDGFDLVITDMAMPVMTGTEFAKKILKIQPDIPIIICTGFSENVDSKIARSIGIKEYIKKPILLDELTAKVRKVLDLSTL